MSNGGRTHQLRDSQLIGLLPVRRRMQLPIVSLPRQQILVSRSFGSVVNEWLYGYIYLMPMPDNIELQTIRGHLIVKLLLVT